MPSRFDKDTIREFFEHCQRTGKKRVNSVGALTDHAYRTASNDDEIREWLFPTETVATVPCPTCGGSGQIPEPKAIPEVCYFCKGQLVIRYNPETDADETWPCQVCQEADFEEQLRLRGGVILPTLTLPQGKGFASLADVTLTTGIEGEGEDATT